MSTLKRELQYIDKNGARRLGEYVSHNLKKQEVYLKPFNGRKQVVHFDHVIDKDILNNIVGV